MTPAPAVSPSLRLTLRRALVLAGLGIGTVALLVVLGGGRAVLEPLAQVWWPPLLLGIALHYASFAVRGHRWQILLRLMGHSLPWLPVTSLLLTGWFASAVLPGRPGDVVRILALRSGSRRLPPVPISDSLGSIVLERVLDIAAIVLMGVIFGFVALHDELPPWVLAVYAAAAGALMLFGLTLVVAPAFLEHLHRLSSRRWWQAALHFLDRFVASLSVLRTRPLPAVLALGESLSVWLVDAALLWLVLVALGESVAFPAAAFVTLTVAMVAVVPLTPGGIGPVETAYAALLALIGLPPATAAAAALLVRGVTYWSFVLFTGAVAGLTGFAALLSAPDPAPAHKEGAAL